MLKPSDDEVRALTASSAKDRYTYFIRRVADFEEAWGLVDEGWAMVADDDGQEAVALWPAKKYAKLARGDDWQDFDAKRLGVDSLVGSFLPGLIELGRQVAVFLVPTHEDNWLVPADALLADLQSELKNYE